MKNRFRDHAVDALFPIHQLGNLEIGGYAGEDVGFFVGETTVTHEEIDHLADGDLRGNGEVFVGPHDDEVGGCLRPRPFEVQIFADYKAKGSGQRRLHGGNINLSVALAGVAVTHLKQGPFYVHGDEKGGAGDQISVIEITRMDAGRRAVDSPIGGRRRHTHTAEERMQRDGYTWREEGRHVFAVQIDDAAVAI